MFPQHDFCYPVTFPFFLSATCDWVSGDKKMWTLCETFLGVASPDIKLEDCRIVGTVVRG